MRMAEYLRNPGLLLCAGENAETIALGGRNFEVRLISAYETALCLKQAAILADKLRAEQMEDSAVLAKSACLCASCLYDGLGRVFERGEEALLRLTTDEMAAVTESYARLRREDFDLCALGDADVMRLRSALERSALERIRWKVLRALNRLPSEEAVRRMTDGQYLYCYVNLLLDREITRTEAGVNESFGRSDGDLDE